MTFHDNDDEPDYDPEAAYLITSCSQRVFTPAAHGLTREMFARHPGIYDFVTIYHTDTGEIPTRTALIKAFPNAGLDTAPMFNLEHLGAEVVKHHTIRVLSGHMADAAEALTGGDLAGAISAISAAGDIKHAAATKPPTPLTDPSLFVKSDDQVRIPVWDGPLMDTTGGIPLSQLWATGARLKSGKSWVMCLNAVAAAKAGHDVIYFSLEMSKPVVASRLHALMLGGWWDESSVDPQTRIKEVADWESAAGGHIRLFDLSDHPVVSPSLVGTYAAEGRLLIVDYIGLMSSQGKSAVDDWRNAAGISNELRKVAGSTGAAVLTAVQLNRMTHPDKTPDLSNIADTDMYARDCDLVHLMNRPADAKAAKHVIAANRHGVTGTTWGTQFAPEIPSFRVIDSRAVTSEFERAKNARQA